MSPDQCTPSWGLAEDSARQLEITRQMGEASWNNRQQTAEASRPAPPSRMYSDGTRGQAGPRSKTIGLGQRQTAQNKA